MTAINRGGVSLEVEARELAESRRVVVPQGFGVAEGLEQRVRRDHPFRNGRSRMRCSTLELGVARRLALRHDGEVVQHQLRRFCFTGAALAADHDGLVPARLLERREGVLGLLEAVGRQTPVGRVVVAPNHVVAVDGEPPAWVTRDRRRRRQTPSPRSSKTPLMT